MTEIKSDMPLKGLRVLEMGQLLAGPPLQVQPGDVKSLDNTAKTMVFASYLMRQDPSLSAEKAVEIATQLTISTDISLKREHEEAARRSTAIPYGFIFSGLCLMALGLSVYLDTPAIISLALLGVTALTIGMTFVIVTGKVTPEGFVKMVTGLKQGKEGQTPKKTETKEEEAE